MRPCVLLSFGRNQYIKFSVLYCINSLKPVSKQQKFWWKFIPEFFHSSEVKLGIVILIQILVKFTKSHFQYNIFCTNIRKEILCNTGYHFQCNSVCKNIRKKILCNTGDIKVSGEIKSQTVMGVILPLCTIFSDWCCLWSTFLVFLSVSEFKHGSSSGSFGLPFFFIAVACKRFACS